MLESSNFKYTFRQNVRINKDEQTKSVVFIPYQLLLYDIINQSYFSHLQNLFL